MAKVIRGGGMFFEDDIKIIDAELDTPLNIPSPPIFSRDELQILYNGNIFVASKTPSDKGEIKSYTLVFGLQEIESPKTQEDKYFSENSPLINKLKKDFIERVVNGIDALDPGSIKGRSNSQLSQELIDRITKVYAKKIKHDKQTLAGKGLITKLDDGSVFNSEMQGCERVLVLDKNVYDLLTIPEYVSVFQNSFEKDFYKKLQEACQNKSPEEISTMITDNKDKVHRKVLPKVRNKIWHSERSGKLYLDGTYWIPQFRENYNNMSEAYKKLLEKKVKIDAARSTKW